MNINTVHLVDSRQKTGPINLLEPFDRQTSLANIPDITALVSVFVYICLLCLAFKSWLAWIGPVDGPAGQWIGLTRLSQAYHAPNHLPVAQKAAIIITALPALTSQTGVFSSDELLCLDISSNTCYTL